MEDLTTAIITALLQFFYNLNKVQQEVKHVIQLHVSDYFYKVGIVESKPPKLLR